MKGKQRVRAALILIAACSACVSGDRVTGWTHMEFDDFARMMKGKDAFEVRFKGESEVSPITGRRYVHYEVVAFVGDGDPYAAYRIMYHTSKDILFICNGRSVTVWWRKIRTRLSPSVEKTIIRASLAAPQSEKDRALLAILDEEKVDRFVLSEYGLEPERTYYATVEFERFYLPPEGPDDPPRTASNAVLVVSDEPLPNKKDLTPVFRNWRY